MRKSPRALRRHTVLFFVVVFAGVVGCVSTEITGASEGPNANSAPVKSGGEARHSLTRG